MVQINQKESGGVSTLIEWSSHTWAPSTLSASSLPVLLKPYHPALCIQNEAELKKKKYYPRIQNVWMTQCLIEKFYSPLLTKIKRIHQMASAPPPQLQKSTTANELSAFK